MRCFFLLLLLVSCKDLETENLSVSVPSADEAQNQEETLRVEPPFWWTGFKEGSLQLLVHYKNIGQAKVTFEYAGVNLVRSNKADSPNYLFLDLSISPKTKPGIMQLSFSFDNGLVITYPFEIKERAKNSDQFIGFDSSDVIYLITPDRFANGDSSNDIVPGMNEQGVDRTDGYSRHGGDLRGIIDHLDYIDEMGFTAIWPTPVLENNMPRASYHGYAITDLYGVDPRFGTLDQMKILSQNLHQRNMKFIMDQVANHCGLEHWWMKDLPFKDWVNYQENFESNAENWNDEVTIQSNHRRTTNQDPYASKFDKEGMEFGWFVKDMPDLNQGNPFMAKYIIQNSIWWIETLQLNGIRQDTYPYPNKVFMANWAAAIMNEYPNFNIVGEEWSYNPLLVGYWQEGKPNKDGYRSHLKSTMDFPMQKAIIDGVNEEESWNFGFVKTYEGLANDFAYSNPNDLLVFLDNHDMSRVYTQLGENLTKTKMALGYLLTMPRIVQLYYGTEILLDDSSNPGDHGLIRTDFPGGWSGDRVNAFTGENLSKEQMAMQSFTRQILNYRKHSKALHQGTTTHFAPENGIYVISRTFGEETVVTILNKNESPVKMMLNRFSEINLNGKTLRNIVSNEEVIWKDVLQLKEKGVIMLSTDLTKQKK